MISNPDNDHRPKCSRDRATLSPQPCEPRYAASLLDVLESANMAEAWKRVRRNKGAAGTDNRTIDDTANYLRGEWPAIRQQLLEGSYKPQPVKTVYIPKANGKQRMLGIPCVIDRLIQQAILQKLSPCYERSFSSSSFGFQRGKNAWQAVSQAHEYVSQGYHIAVDIDLEKFFDKVNHDLLMGMLSKRISDRALLKLIRIYLNNGMMEDGIVSQREKGTPQGSPLSPLLSNILLDALDKELEARGHRFCRYADDVQIYVRSKRAGDRVLKSLTDYLESRLKLVVNRGKSKVGPVTQSSFLGYSFVGLKNPRIRCSKETIQRFKQRVRELTRGHDRRAIEEKLQRLDRYLRGWTSYFRLAQTKRLFADLDSWIRSRLRMCLMKQWFKPRTRVRNMIKLGLPVEEAKGYGQHKRWWFYAQLHHTRFYLNNAYWSTRGYHGVSYYLARFANA